MRTENHPDRPTPQDVGFSPQQDLDFSGRALAELGMAQTIEVETDDWIANAVAALRRFARIPGWHEFKTEDFRAWYLDSGLPAPHDHHLWGALTNRAAREGVIRFTGRYAPSVSPKTHGHPVKVWTA
jgi:hypothetical protein